MNLAEQAHRRLIMAAERNLQVTHWIATPAAIDELAHIVPDAFNDDRSMFVGLPLDVGPTKSDWGLDLVCVPPAG